MKKRPYMIFIDGQDRSGKTTVVKRLFEKRGKIDIVVDRGPLSNFVYTRMFKRNCDTSKYVLDFQEAKYLIIYLDVPIDELKRRTIETNDYEVPLEDIEKHKKAFNIGYKFFKLANITNVYRVKCENKTSEQIVDEIIKFLKYKDSEEK